MEEAQTQQTQAEQAGDSAPPPIDEHRVWEEAVGGPNRNRIYGVGTFRAKSLSQDSVTGAPISGAVGSTFDDSEVRERIHIMNIELQTQAEENQRQRVAQDQEMARVARMVEQLQKEREEERDDIRRREQDMLRREQEILRQHEMLRQQTLMMQQFFSMMQAGSSSSASAMPTFPGFPPPPPPFTWPHPAATPAPPAGPPSASVPPVAAPPAPPAPPSSGSGEHDAADDDQDGIDYS